MLKLLAKEYVWSIHTSSYNKDYDISILTSDVISMLYDCSIEFEKARTMIYPKSDEELSLCINDINIYNIPFKKNFFR
ncbi:hypothetical protein BTW14_gp183 [BeAn 58058 virus]|uniref:hypothetical protein n=1 Tax=BeAn 58058 virus TaxID=67082 RepID=UPI00090A6E7E|nr:hypothetical protein BTW14_gp183 [BeAn 58058 virus]APG58374.1 hypothetical protein BAV00198 [BeAn 58058 virus]